MPNPQQLVYELVSDVVRKPLRGASRVQRFPARPRAAGAGRRNFLLYIY